MLQRWRCPSVLVQPEMERGRSPLVSIPPFGRGFSRHRYDHQAIPQHGCVPAEPASVSPGKIIVAPPCPSVSTSGYPVIRSLRVIKGDTITRTMRVGASEGEG